MLDWLPVYFQSSKGAGPIASGVDILAAPLPGSFMGIVAGISVQKTNKYRPQMWFGWCLLILGVGLLSHLNENSSRAQAIVFEALTGIGGGIAFVTGYFPVLAPIPVEQNTPALAFHTFLRNFAQVTCR